MNNSIVFQTKSDLASIIEDAVINAVQVSDEDTNNTVQGQYQLTISLYYALVTLSHSLASKASKCEDCILTVNLIAMLTLTLTVTISRLYHNHL
jgi:hypothetical protein